MKTLTNEQIADRLDGLKAGGFEVGKSATDDSLVWLIYEHIVQPVPSENILAFCRAVVERVDGESGQRVKTWAYWPGCDCPDCGSSTEILTKYTKEGWTNDCDPIRCSDPDCPRHTEAFGHTIVYDVDSVSGDFEAWPIGDDGKPYNPKEPT